MATDKEKANKILGYRSVIGVAGLVGLIGGFLFGIWDSITVIIDRGLPSNALSEMLSLFIYSVSIYAVIGCLGMAIIGAVSGILIRTGNYSVNKSRRAMNIIAVFVLLTVAVILAEIIMFGNIVDIVESTVISILSGVGLAALIMYALSYAFNMLFLERRSIPI